MGKPEMDWRGQAGPLRVFKSRGKGERKEEGTPGRKRDSVSSEVAEKEGSMRI